MAHSLHHLLVAIVLLAGFQHGTSESDGQKPSDRQGSLVLPGGSVLVPYGQGRRPAPQNQGGYSPVVVPYPYFPEPSYPGPYYPDPYYPVPQPLPKPARNNFLRTLLLLFAFSGVFNPTTTTAPTTTTFPGTCQWGAWTACSTICRGTRSRSRMCNGVTQAESEMCNTETGFRPDGNWYRAANCYDYLWSTATVTSKDAATTACTGLSARLASLGLRTDSIRTDIVTQFVTARGLGALTDAYVGISNEDVATTWVWTDGYTGNPTFWKNGEPGTATTACIVLEKGNAYGLSDETCASTARSYLCERAAQ